MVPKWDALLPILGGEQMLLALASILGLRFVLERYPRPWVYSLR